MYLLSSSYGRALGDIQLQFHGNAKMIDIFCLPNCEEHVEISQLRVEGSTSAY